MRITVNIVLRNIISEYVIIIEIYFILQNFVVPCRFTSFYLTSKLYRITPGPE